MQVSKWGNSLAIRLPKEAVDKLGLKEGDELKLVTDGERTMLLTRDLTREEALARLRALQWKLPADFKFDREEAHERS